jgi:hypothetical protein
MNNNEAPAPVAPLAAEPFGPDTLASLLRLIAARADGLLTGPTIDATIDAMIVRGKDSGWIIATITADDLRPVRIPR